MQKSEGLPIPQRYWALSTILLGLALMVIDDSIANVALPTLANEFGVDPSQTIWVVNAYQLAAAVCLIPFARLADIFGHRLFYCLGLLLFGAASLACAMSDSLTELVLSRVVQGIGAAGAMSVNIALTRFIYPGRLLGRGLGYNALVVACSAGSGPSIAGGILSVASWPWLFAINVPLAIVVVALGWRYLPDTPRAEGRFDVASAVLCAASLGLLIFGIGAIGRDGLEASLAIGTALVLGFFLIRRERRARVPLVPIDLLRIPLFRLSVMTSIGAFAAQSLALVSLPFYYQHELGQSEAMTGLLMTPWPVAVAVLAPIAGRMADRYHPGLLGMCGLVLLSAGLGLLAALPQDPAILDIVWRSVLAGIGVGLFQTPNNRAMIGSTPLARSGAAAGTHATARLFGQAAGAAVASVVFLQFAGNASTAALATAAVLAIIAASISGLRIRE